MALFKAMPCSREDRINYFRSLVFIVAAGGGFLYGSPLPRVFLGIFFMLVSIAILV